MGLALYGDSAEDVTLIEDSLITGVLRERLPHVRCRSRSRSRRHQDTLLALLFRLEVLAVRPLPWRLFSWFSLGHLFKETFFNDLIISKRSSRGGVSGYSHHVVKLFII